MNILAERIGDIHILKLNRPQAANALNTAMAMEIIAFLRGLSSLCHPSEGWDPEKKKMDSSIRWNDKIKEIPKCLIITGQGDKAFCAGADLKERKGMSEQEWSEQHHIFEEMLGLLLDAEYPIIAAMNGAAIGGGFEIALACDFIIASHGAKFGLTEAGLGIMPGLGGTQNLARACGVRLAKKLLFTGEIFSAEYAFAQGIVSELCDDALANAIICAEKIVSKAPLSIKAIKRAVNQGIEQPLLEGLEAELRLYNSLIGTQDRLEGINAFNEKRKAEFWGE